MHWSEYVRSVLENEKQLDNIRITINEKEMEIPSIIRASVYLLEKMIKEQGRYNLFVFPDGKYTPFVFMLSKLIYNIEIGKIESNYDVTKFVPGQKLRFGNSIAEFIKIDYEKSYKEDAIYLKFSDCTYICKIDYAPFFQTVDTKKPLSKLAKFNYEKKAIAAETVGHSEVLKTLSDMKTHMSESMIYISSISKSTELMKNIKVDNHDLSDVFFVSQTDYTGKIETVKGLYSGIPALILSSNIAYANEAVRGGAQVQSIIINLNDNDIDSQLAELDELVQLKVPIVCIADTIHSFDLNELKLRGFNIWRWDENSITNEMFAADDLFSNKNKICCKQNIIYHNVEAPLTSEAFDNLYSKRKEIEEESVTINRVYNLLFEYSSMLLRKATEINKDEKMTIINRITECSNVIESEKNFIKPELYDAFLCAMNCMTEALLTDEVLAKIKAIEKIVIEEKNKKICFICSNNDDTEIIKKYWTDKFYRHGYSPIFIVLTVKDFIKNPVSNDYTIFVLGWFGAKKIRNIFYSYDVDKIFVFLCESERRWKKVHSRAWKRKLNNDNNGTIIKKSFVKSNSNIDISIDNTMFSADDFVETDEIDILDDTELIIQENKYRQYISRGIPQSGVSVDAKPVSFIGGEFAFFTKGHKSLVVTKIVHQMTNKIEEKETDELRVGDFIVIREASKDLIKEVADKILYASGKEDIRKRVEIWKEALRIESTFSSLEDIYEKLKAEGCNRNIMTVKNWINSESIIIPQSKDDLVSIAKATSDDVLMEKLDSIFEEGTLIKRAHIKAGNILSDRLTTSIAEKLMNDRSFDPYNIWEPIELNLEEVGLVRIFKIIDISTNWITVNSFDTNRLMTEEKEV